jgi:hypothetical protein
MAITRKVILSRFERAVAFWRTLQPEQFDISQWISRGDKETQCGTVCCLVGWMPKVDKRWYWRIDPQAVREFRLEMKGMEESMTIVQARNYFGFKEPLASILFYAKEPYDALSDEYDFAFYKAFSEQCPAVPGGCEYASLEDVLRRVEWVLAELKKPDSLVWKLTACPDYRKPAQPLLPHVEA